MKILVTGGAGYIGSHTVDLLVRMEHEVVVYDNLSTGDTSLVIGGQLIVGDLSDVTQLESLFAQHTFEAVIHFAASTSVEESAEKPAWYYQNNVCNTLSLLRQCVVHRVRWFIFSSTAAVYGAPDILPIPETCLTLPKNPYGYSKLFAERMLRDIAASYGAHYVILRYYNAAGADADLRLGEIRPTAKHLITVACRAAAGMTEGIEIFGTDYPTPDGTCVRDFVHVTDLADTHVKALQYISDGGESVTLNCGYGRGFSVREVLHVVKEVSGVDFPVREGARRKMDVDPPTLIADNTKIKKTLDWRPVFDDIRAIIATAWKWQLKRNKS